MSFLKRITTAGAIAVAFSVSGVAQAQTTYNIASMADFTGPYADVMRDLIAARKPVLDWWNAEVGAKIGVKLSMKDYDHRYDAAQVASLWPGIKAELNPIAALGIGGPDVAALQGRLPTDKVPLIMSTASYGFAWKPDPWIFNFRPTYSHEAAAVTEWMRSKKGGSGPIKIGIITSEASPAYVDQARGLERFAKDNPDKLQVVEAVFAEVQPADLTTQVNRIARGGAELIVCHTNTAAVVATKRALQALGRKIPILMSSHNGLQDSGRAVGGLAQLEGDFDSYAMAVPSDEKTPARAFFDMLAAKYSLKGNWSVTTVQGLGQALVTVRAVEAAARKVGADKITGEAMREALLSTTFSAADTFSVLPDVTFTKDGPFPTAGLTVSAGTVSGGKYTAAIQNAPVPTINKW